jgi:murein L,D-transpeptidase YcbB/YkuD
MSAYRAAATAVLLGLTALSLTGCGNGSPFGGGGAAEARPDEVTAQALRAAAGDDQVRRFYEKVGWKAVWDTDGEQQLLEALEQAAVHALSTANFVEGELPVDPAEREAALTKAALRYAAALADGYTDPTQLREIYTVPRAKADVAAGLAEAIASDKVAEWLASLAPQTEEYRKLSEAFVHYLRQAESGASGEIGGGENIRPGGSDPRVPRIVEALAANGYLDPQQAQQPNPQAYTAAIANAVKRMQNDFGIKADGIVGKDTLQVLNAGAADRARKLAVNLERLRWLERNPPATRIDVNTAAAFLDYWQDGRHADRRRVVVGEPGWETPQLGSPMYALVANPNWVVPESIYEDELADKGPGYFAANNMVRRDGRIVQLPGPDNALGLVKFALRNDHAIYLHDTPAKALFAENERHRSHGCVRVENALEFAHMIAASQGVLPQFSRAMANDDETQVELQREIPVRLMYHTAFVDGAGRVQFRTDAYGWDEDVARALGREAREKRELRPHERGRDIGP